MTEFKHGEITEKIIGAAYEVYRVLGYGFLERVYQRAMKVELESQGLKTELEPQVKVEFKGIIVGDYRSDLLVEEKVMVEIKTSKHYRAEHEALLLNQLKGTKKEVGLLVNFGRECVDFKRMVF